MTETVYAPPDVVAGLVGFLRKRGVNARTRVPLDRAPGLVRVTRTGGGPINPSQDDAQLLIEVWEADQAACFDLARTIWGMLALVSRDDQDAFPGLICYEAVPSVPIQYPDPDAPRLDRHQLTVRMICRLEQITI